MSPGVQRIQWDKQEAKPWKGAGLVVPKGRRNPTSHFSASDAKQRRDPLWHQHLSLEMLQLPAKFSCRCKQGICKPWELCALVSPSQMVMEGQWALRRSKGKMGNTSLTLWAGLL